MTRQRIAWLMLALAIPFGGLLLYNAAHTNSMLTRFDPSGWVTWGGAVGIEAGIGAVTVIGMALKQAERPGRWTVWVVGALVLVSIVANLDHNYRQTMPHPARHIVAIVAAIPIPLLIMGMSRGLLELADLYAQVEPEAETTTLEEWDAELTQLVAAESEWLSRQPVPDQLEPPTDPRQQAIEMHRSGQMSGRAIARELELPASTVGRWLRDAREET